MITYAQFVGAFPEFKDFDSFPQTQIDFWIGEAANQLDQSPQVPIQNQWNGFWGCGNRFGTRLDLATMLFVAHNLTLSARDTKAALAGGIPGEAIGPTASKTVGPVGIGYDAAGSALPMAGAWNLTSYGMRLYKLIRIAGIGGAYVGNPQAGRFDGAFPWLR